MGLWVKFITQSDFVKKDNPFRVTFLTRKLHEIPSKRTYRR